jgi:hypothetical protein
MKYLDVATQTIIFATGIIILFFSWGDADWPMDILLAQLMLGPWQMISSIVSVIGKTPFYRKKRIHLLLAAIYLIVLYAYIALDSGIIPHSETVSRLMFIVPAWALATFYYALTWKWVFLRKKSVGNFLPHLSF